MHPFNSSLTFTDQRKKNYRFYQRTIDEDLVLMDAPKSGIFDFQRLMDLERSGRTCERVDVYVDIYCDCDEAWVEDWYKGYLRLSKGDWDVSGCSVKIPVEVSDTFNCLTTNWTKDFNMFDYGDPPIEVTPFYGVVEYTTCTSGVVKNEFNADDWTVQEVINYMNQQFWTELVTDCLTDVTPGSANAPWTLIKHAYVSDFKITPGGLFGPGKVKVETIYKTMWAREFSASVTEPPGGGWVAVTGGWARGVNTAIGPVYDHTTAEGVQEIEEFTGIGEDDWDWGKLATWLIVGLDENGNSILTNGKAMNPVLEEWLLGNCDLTIISNFYGINPDGTNPDNKYYDAAAEECQNIVLFQVTDVARTDETQSATRAQTTFKKMVDALRVAHNIDMDIDGDVLRIEHVSYWERTVGMDLTQAEFLYLIEGRWKYTYDGSKLPRKEYRKWGTETDKEGGDFDGYPIEYDNDCVNDMDEAPIDTQIAEQFITNVQYVVNKEEFFDSELILMVSTDDGVITYAEQPISGYNKLNGRMAMGYLMDKYHDHSRPFKRGFINKTERPFYLSLRPKKQVPIPMPMQCSDYINIYDPADTIKTQLGAGEIDKASMKFPDQVLTVTLNQK